MMEYWPLVVAAAAIVAAFALTRKQGQDTADAVKALAERIDTKLDKMQASISEGSTALGRVIERVDWLTREVGRLDVESQRQRESIHVLRNDLSRARLRAAGVSPWPSDDETP